MIENNRQLLQRVIGVPLVSRGSVAGAMIGVAISAPIVQSPGRVGFVFVNLSVNTIYLTPVGDPSATRGIRVGPGGGTVRCWVLEDGEAVGWEWRAIADAAGSSYFLLETLIQLVPEV